MNGRVLPRIFKMPVQKGNSKSSAHPDLVVQLLQILIPTIFSHVPEDGLLERYMVITSKKSKWKILHRNFCLSKKKYLWKLPVRKTD